MEGQHCVVGRVYSVSWRIFRYSEGQHVNQGDKAEDFQSFGGITYSKAEKQHRVVIRVTFSKVEATQLFGGIKTI